VRGDGRSCITQQLNINSCSQTVGLYIKLIPLTTEMFFLGVLYYKDVKERWNLNWQEQRRLKFMNVS